MFHKRVVSKIKLEFISYILSNIRSHTKMHWLLLIPVFLGLLANSSCKSNYLWMKNIAITFTLGIFLFCRSLMYSIRSSESYLHSSCNLTQWKEKGIYEFSLLCTKCISDRTKKNKQCRWVKECVTISFLFFLRTYQPLFFWSDEPSIISSNGQ